MPRRRRRPWSGGARAAGAQAEAVEWRADREAREAAAREAARHSEMDGGAGSLHLADDREDVQPGDRVLLIVDNDENFGRFLLDLAREKGFKGLLATRG